MTQEEIKNYCELNNKFEDECYRVCKILEGLERIKNSDGHDIRFAEEFVVDGDDILWSGEETWQYGGYEYHTGSFPVKYLTMTDDELKAVVDEDNKLFHQEAKEDIRQKEEVEKAKRREEYERLRKEFEE